MNAHTWTTGQGHTLRNRRTVLACLGAAVAAATLGGCAATSNTEMALGSEGSQVALRAIQQRWFETGNMEHVLRGTISTLQDLGFIVDKADADLGTVSGTKVGGDAWSGNKALKLTVTVRDIGARRTLVRANAQWGTKTVEEPKPYQQFFNSLSKGLFLEANTME